MPHNTITQAVVLSIKPAGENNSSVCFLTQTEGIIYATMYGGPKSRLRSLVSTWNTGTVYLSESQKGKSLKISDFDVTKYHLSFRESLYKMCAASLAAELTIKTKCAGSPSKCWILVNGFIDGLEHCTAEEQCMAGLIRFLWRFLDILGIGPDASCCRQCGAEFLTGKIEADGVSYIPDGAVFYPSENSFICSKCTAEKQPFYLTAEAIRYLSAVSILTPAEARQLPLSKESAYQIKQIVFFLAENACGTKLKSLETGIGIL